MKPHHDQLEKIYQSIYMHIDQIFESQKESGGALDRNNAAILVEYGKFFRTDKSAIEDEIDYSKMSAEELDAEILKAASSVAAGKASK